jgi:hypothetical protein
VAIDYLAEVPNRRLIREIEEHDPRVDGDFNEQKIAALIRGLHIRAKGEPLSLVSVDLGEDHLRSRPNGSIYKIRLEGPLPEGCQSLSIRNGNHPDELAYFFTEVRVSEDLEIASSSLFRIQDGQRIEDKSGRWWIDENMRVFSVEFHAKAPSLFENRIFWAFSLIVICLFTLLVWRTARRAKAKE